MVMTRKRYVRNESDIENLLKQGRGAGTGKDYKPYIFVREIPSLGRSHRVYGKRSGRVHHLLSDIEYAHYLAFDIDESVVDIREQFALDRDKTMKIAATLGFRHPKDPRSDTNLVMTTDLVISYRRNAVQIDSAFSIKPASQLSNNRVNEKLKIEQQYWSEKNISFQILTERDIPLHLKRNLQWLRQYRDLSIFDEPFPGYYKDLLEHLLGFLSQANANDIKLCQACQWLDEYFACDPGSHLMMARHMLSTRIVLSDLSREQLWNIPVSEISVNPYLYNIDAPWML